MSQISLARKEIINALIPYAEKDPTIQLLICDMGFGVADKFKEKFHNRVYNMGMMEQATVGIAAGMAMAGLKPIVYSIINFLAFRALEQIRNDVVLQKLNVKFIGTGANNYFKFLGHSHCCGDTDKEIFELINLDVFDPYLPYIEPEAAFPKIVDDWIESPKAGYFRT